MYLVFICPIKARNLTKMKVNSSAPHRKAVVLSTDNDGFH